MAIEDTHGNRLTIVRKGRADETPQGTNETPAGKADSVAEAIPVAFERHARQRHEIVGALQIAKAREVDVQQRNQRRRLREAVAGPSRLRAVFCQIGTLGKNDGYACLVLQTEPAFELPINPVGPSGGHYRSLRGQLQNGRGRESVFLLVVVAAKLTIDLHLPDPVSFAYLNPVPTGRSLLKRSQSSLAFR